MSAIEALKERFPETQVLLRGTAGHEERNKSYLSTHESDIEPDCIFLPESKADVAAFVKLISPLVNSDPRTAFAIRGGGQQPAPGCANIQDGITLDLDLLKGVQVQDGIVSVGAGERWGTVYRTVQDHGLGVTGSRSSKGGIGGLSLSGGLSFFSSREGFICDNVVNYEVVLASGEIVNANETENHDLWIALRGGGNNLGIVTRFDLRTFEQGPFWGGSVYYFPDKFPDQIQAMTDELHRESASDETHLMLSIGYAAQFGQTMCMNQTYYTKAIERPAVLEPFTSVQPQVDAMNSMRMLDLVAASGEQTNDSMAAVRTSYMNITVKADTDTLRTATLIYTRELEKIKPCEGLVCSLTLQPYPVSLLRKSATLGGNSLGLSADAGPLVSVLLLTNWNNSADDSILTSTLSDALQHIKKYAQERETLIPFIYMNYSWTDQNPIDSYGEANKEKLQQTSRKYDPDAIFQKGVPGGWKLFD